MVDMLESDLKFKAITINVLKAIEDEVDYTRINGRVIKEENFKTVPK